MTNYVFYVRGRLHGRYKKLATCGMQALVIALFHGKEVTSTNCFCDQIRKCRRKKKNFAFERMLQFLDENPHITHVYTFSRLTFPKGYLTELELLEKGYTICYADKKIWAEEENL